MARHLSFSCHPKRPAQVRGSDRADLFSTGHRYTLRGTSYLLHRLGYTPQVPVHRAAQRDEAKIAAWRAVTWAKVRG